MTDRFVVVPASYLILRRGQEVLLQLRQGTGFRDGFWALGAAGHVEQGESALTACCREASEELGITVRTEDLEPVCTLHRYSPSEERLGTVEDERVDFFFTATRWAGEPRRVETHKSADLRWFDLDHLPEPVVPHELVVLTALRRGPVPPILTSGW